LPIDKYRLATQLGFPHSWDPWPSVVPLAVAQC